MRTSSAHTCARLAVRLRLKLPSGNTGETLINLLPLDQYGERKAALTDEQIRLSLDLIEEGIATDPIHRVSRQQVGEVIWDKSEPGLAVAFRVEGDTILLLTFVLLFEA
jgi:hypothetical protein